MERRMTRATSRVISLPNFIRPALLEPTMTGFLVWLMVRVYWSIVHHDRALKMAEETLSVSNF